MRAREPVPLDFPDAPFSLYREQTPRLSTCVRCKQTITKGEMRVVFAYPPRYERLPKKGGRVFTQRRFLHEGCFASLFEGTSPGRDEWLTCTDCREHGVPTPHRCVVGSRQNYARLCDRCIRSGRWRYCRYCTVYWTRYATSPVLEGSVPDGHFCCDSCQAEHKILTVKMRKQLDRMSNVERERWWELRGRDAVPGF